VTRDTYRWLTLLGLLAGGCGPGRPADIGSPCRDDSDCVFGECYTGSEPGYCTASCEDEGSTEPCPEGTVCKKIEGGPASCLLLCEEDRECPPNAQCNSVPGSGGLQGCEPVL
jgi:hypothetical protein